MMASATQVSAYADTFSKGVWDDAASDCSTADANHNDDASSVGFSDAEDSVQTVVIFDWDDTLFPTTWLRRHGFLDGMQLSHDHEVKLRALADVVEQTLRTAMLCGKVMIITNGQKGWVEKSCLEAMPSLMQVLQEVEIVSARSSYEGQTQDPSEWKRLAFIYEVEQLSIQSDQQLNVLSLGDSLNEQHAVMSLSELMPNCFTKSLKFVDAPAIEELLDQHEFVNNALVDVAEHSGHLDVEIGARGLE